MQPGIDMRIRTMIKAMTEVVLPAVDPGASAAQDQARLVIGSLDLLIEQIDHAHWYEVVDIRDHHALVVALARLIGAAAADAARPIAETAIAVAARHEVTLSELREQNRLLRDAVDRLIEAIGPDDRTALTKASRLVLDHSRGQLARERAYVAKTRFDTDPETLLTIRQSLELAAA